MIGERDRRHLEPCCLVHERRDPTRAVEDRVLGVDVEVDERGGQGKATLPRWSADSAGPEAGCLGRFARPELVGESPPRVAQIGPSGHALQLPVRPHEGAEIGFHALALALLEHAHVPRPGSTPASAARSSALSRSSLAEVSAGVMPRLSAPARRRLRRSPRTRYRTTADCTSCVRPPSSSRDA